MKKTPFLVPLLLCLALFGDSRPGSAVSLGPASADLLDHLEKEGWQTVTAGVMQRSHDSDKVETLGFGADGLRFQLSEMKAHLAFLRKEYARQPSLELRRAIHSQRAVVLRVQATLKKTDAPGGLESANEAILAEGGTCPVNYDASVDAFPLTQGASAQYEMERAAVDPVNAIQHALAFASPYVCPTWRYPAEKSGGSSTVAGCIPMGARVFLDGSADCSAVSTTGEKAICYALQNYGAYAVTHGGNSFGMYFETPTGGQPGGSGPDPYPGVRAPVRGEGGVERAAPFLAEGGRRERVDRHQPEFQPAHREPRRVRHPRLRRQRGDSAHHRLHQGMGTCGVSLQPVPIHAGWKPSRGNGSMSVIDHANRKVYDLIEVARNADGTVMVNADGTVSVGWGSISDLDGNGRSHAVNGANLSLLFGTVRVFEMECAATDPANAIQHALAFTSKYACSTFRYPAAVSNGTSTGTGCIPVGARIFLDSGADCSTVSPVGEKAVCYALQKYGAYAIGTGGSTFSFKFEVPTEGQTGGSGADPYPGAGIVGDYYNMVSIPWSRLKVAPDCQCTPY